MRGVNTSKPRFTLLIPIKHLCVVAAAALARLGRQNGAKVDWDFVAEMEWDFLIHVHR